MCSITNIIQILSVFVHLAKYRADGGIFRESNVNLLGRRVIKLRIAVCDHGSILELTRYKTVRVKRLFLFQMKVVVTSLLVESLDS